MSLKKLVTLDDEFLSEDRRALIGIRERRNIGSQPSRAGLTCVTPTAFVTRTAKVGASPSAGKPRRLECSLCRDDKVKQGES
jgi:hypothetical protein